MFNFYLHKNLKFTAIVLMAFFELKAQNSPDITAFLQKNNASVFGRINAYDKNRHNLLINQSKFSVQNGKQTQVFANSEWEINTSIKKVADKADAIDIAVTYKLVKGELKEASVSLDVDFEQWAEKNYVLLPAAAYNGNRYEWRKLRYSPKLYEVQDIGIDKPIILTDVPRLSNDGGYSKLSDRSGACAVPSVGFYSDTTKKGAWMITKQGNTLGDYGITVEETRDRKKATISLTSPIVRELYVYFFASSHYPTWDIPKDFKAGDEVTISTRLYGFEAMQLQTLYDKFTTIRKDFSANDKESNTFSYSSCFKVIEEKQNKLNFEPKFGYYSVGFRENFLQDWQIGWTGGMITTYPLLFAGSQETRKNVIRNFDWLFPNGISPSGFYWDSGKEGTVWLGGDVRKPQCKNWHLIRKSADAVYYIVKQFMLMEKMGVEVKPSWKNGNQVVTDAFVKLWNKYHQLGQFVDSETGEIRVGGSASAAIAPAALALASNYYKKPEYLQTAIEIGDYFNENFVKKGLFYGGPGDALQNFDSESGYCLVETFVTLYETTGDKKWLEIAKNAAKQFSTWVVPYNFEFPASSLFGKTGIKTLGSVYANTQNKHSAPAMCTYSGQGLFKLYRMTGDVFYLNLIKDIAHNMPQYLSHPKRPLGDQPFGYMSERVNMTDWERKMPWAKDNGIGEIFLMSTWVEPSMMLTTIELPGLYVNAAKETVTAFDNIEAKIIASTKKQITVELNNPTQTDAEVRLFEDDANKSKMLGENYLYNGQIFKINAGEKKVMVFAKK